MGLIFDYDACFSIIFVLLLQKIDLFTINKVFLNAVVLFLTAYERATVTYFMHLRTFFGASWQFFLSLLFIIYNIWLLIDPIA